MAQGPALARERPAHRQRGHRPALEPCGGVSSLPVPDARRLTFEVEGRLASTPPIYRVGATVRVLYDPANPADARIDRAAFGAGGIVLLLAIGALFAAAGVWAWHNAQ